MIALKKNYCSNIISLWEIWLSVVVTGSGTGPLVLFLIPHLDSRCALQGTLELALVCFGWLSGVPGPLECQAGPLLGGWVILRLVGPWVPHSSHAWVARALLCCLLGRCEVVPAVGCLSSLLSESCRVPGSWGHLCLLLIPRGEGVALCTYY